MCMSNFAFHNSLLLFFFFNDTATTEIYTLSLHDALPIWQRTSCLHGRSPGRARWPATADRKSTRLNSSHTVISYAVFCLKKKKRYNEYIHKKKKNVIEEIYHKL